MNWKETSDEKYQDAKTDSIPFSELSELECRICGHEVEMVLQPSDFNPWWSANCPDCNAHYSAQATEVKITQSEGGL